MPRASCRRCPCCRHGDRRYVCVKCARQQLSFAVPLGVASKGLQSALSKALGGEKGHPARLRDHIEELQTRVAALRGSVNNLAAKRDDSRRVLQARQQEMSARRHCKVDAERGLASTNISWRSFWMSPRGPEGHLLGAFHPIRELFALVLTLQSERKAKCSELLRMYPYQFLSGEVHEHGVERIWVQVLRGLAAYLDLDLPFPCCGDYVVAFRDRIRGTRSFSFDAVRSNVELVAARQGVPIYPTFARTLWSALRSKDFGALTPPSTFAHPGADDWTLVEDSGVEPLRGVEPPCL